MCSAWLPTVFGEIDSRCAISLFESPRASSRSTSTSRGVSPAGPSRRRGTRWPAAPSTASTASRVERPGCAARRQPAPRRAPRAEAAVPASPDTRWRAVRMRAELRRERARASGASASDCCSMRSVMYSASAAAPIRRRRAARACRGSRSRRRAGRSRARAPRAGGAARRRRQASPAPASAARSATARACPRKYGDFRSTKVAIAARARSNRSSSRTTESPGSASTTALQLDASSRPGRIASASCMSASTTCGSNCLPRRCRATALRPRRRRPGSRPPRTPRTARCAPVTAPVRRAGRRASRARPTARTTRRAHRTPPPTARAARRACARSGCATRSCRPPRGGPRARTRGRAGSGGGEGAPGRGS